MAKFWRFEIGINGNLPHEFARLRAVLNDNVWQIEVPGVETLACVADDPHNPIDSKLRNEGEASFVTVVVRTTHGRAMLRAYEEELDRLTRNIVAVNDPGVRPFAPDAERLPELVWWRVIVPSPWTADTLYATQPGPDPVRGVRSLRAVAAYAVHHAAVEAGAIGLHDDQWADDAAVFTILAPRRADEGKLRRAVAGGLWDAGDLSGHPSPIRLEDVTAEAVKIHDPAELTRADAEWLLEMYGGRAGQERLVLAAHQLGISAAEIQRLSGIARTTVAAILERTTATRT